MSRWLLAAVLAVGVAGCPKAKNCPPCSTTGSGDGDSGSSDDVAAIQRTVESWRQAFEVRSTEALAPLYAQTKDLVVVNQGVVTTGWSAVEAMLKEKLARASQIYMRLTEIKVSLENGAPIASAALTREISDGVTSVQETGALTMSFGRDGDKWVIVSEHFSFRPR
jgi:ketosteroid isomerase-like protein